MFHWRRHCSIVQRAGPGLTLAVTTSPAFGTACCAPRLTTLTTGLCTHGLDVGSDQQ